MKITIRPFSSCGPAIRHPVTRKSTRAPSTRIGTMRHRTLRIRQLLGVATLAVAAGVDAQTIANGPHYATPSWDQTMLTSTRFVVLANFNSEAVLDRETGLVWQRTPYTTPLTYLNAAGTDFLSETGARYGWRLPSINELTSLFDPSSSIAPFLPAGHPFNVSTNDIGYWSSSAVTVTSSSVTPSVPARYITAGFQGHFIIRTYNEGSNNANGVMTWCVRGPGSAGANGG